MSKTRKIVIAVSVIVVLGFIAAGLFMVFYRGKTYGITHGTYVPIDENGNKIDVTTEYTWRIYKDGVKYGYEEGILMQEDNKIYYFFDDAEMPRKFEMRYDKKTDILTVYMWEEYPKNSEIKAFQFERRTIFDIF